MGGPAPALSSPVLHTCKQPSGSVPPLHLGETDCRVRSGRFPDCGEIQAVHVTAFGLCLHDFAVTPCPYHLNCVRGCPDYLRTTGSSSERNHWVQIELATERARECKGPGDIARAWVTHYEETLDGVRKALAVDQDPGVADGGLVKPFAGGRRRR